MQTIDKAAGKEAAAPTLKEGKATPLFYLPTLGGGESGPAALRSKYNMVLLFLEGGEGSETYLLALSAMARDIEAEQARVLAVIAQPLARVKDLASRLNLPFTLLADAEGRTTARMLGDAGRAALCVADRYGSVAYVEIKRSEAELSGAEAALDWLQFLEIQCPE